MENSEEISVVEDPKKARFPWSEDNINILLDLYDTKIHLFLDKHHSQISLWRKLYSQMLPKIPEKDKPNLTVNKLIAKFNHLRKKFKVEFYSAEPDTNFLFYNRMNEMFTNYAMKRLNETNPDDTTDEQIHSMIVDILNEDPDDMDVEVTNSNSRQSANTTLKKKIHELPKSSLVIQREKIRIDPNTPFNRQSSYNSIMNQRESFRNSYAYHQTLSKRKLDDDSDFKIPKIIKKVNSTPHVNDSRADYVIEALDECDLSNVSMRHSKVIYKDQSSKGFHETTAKSVNHSSNDKTKILNETVKGRKQEIVPKKLNLVQKSSDTSVNSSGDEFVYIIEDNDDDEEEDLSAKENAKQVIVPRASQNSNTKLIPLKEVLPKNVSSPSNKNSSVVGNASKKSEYQSTKEVSSTSIINSSKSSQINEDYSIAEIPPLNISSESECSVFDVLRSKEAPQQQISLPKVQVLKDVQNLSSSVENTLKKPELSNQQPPWFTKFLNKYENDMKSINDKLDYLINASQSPGLMIPPRRKHIRQ